MNAQNPSYKTQLCCLNDIAPGEWGTVYGLLSTGAMRRRLLDVGLIENTQVGCLGRSPGGDPSAYFIRGAVFAIRSEDGADILVLLEREEK